MKCAFLSQVLDSVNYKPTDFILTGINKNYLSLLGFAAEPKILFNTNNLRDNLGKSKSKCHSTCLFLYLSAPLFSLLSHCCPLIWFAPWVCKEVNHNTAGAGSGDSNGGVSQGSR